MILNGSAHVFLNLNKNNKQSLKIYPGTLKIIENVKCNKTITALHFVQYDVSLNTEKQYLLRPSALVNIAFQCSITHHIALNEVWSAITYMYCMLLREI